MSISGAFSGTQRVSSNRRTEEIIFFFLFILVVFSYSIIQMITRVETIVFESCTRILLKIIYLGSGIYTIINTFAFFFFFFSFVLYLHRRDN